MRLAIHAPAKVNLTLEILSRRDDGYHALRSLIVPLEFGDELQIETSDAFAFSCTDGTLANDDNLCVRAVRALPALEPRRVHLIKRVPAQAGLGGGSSDAAAILHAAMEGAFGALPTLDWLGIARSLGSDVPFFLARGGALVEGTGERVTAIGEMPQWRVLIIKPPVAISTRWAYAELDRHQRSSRPRNTSITLRALEAVQRGEFDRLEPLLSNDFQSVIASTEPAIERALGALRRAGASNALLCGSGAAVCTLAPNRERVEAIASKLDLPLEFLRFETGFAATPAWRSART